MTETVDDWSAMLSGLSTKWELDLFADEDRRSELAAALVQCGLLSEAEVAQGLATGFALYVGYEHVGLGSVDYFTKLECEVCGGRKASKHDRWCGECERAGEASFPLSFQELALDFVRFKQAVEWIEEEMRDGHYIPEAHGQVFWPLREASTSRSWKDDPLLGEFLSEAWEDDAPF